MTKTELENRLYDGLGLEELGRVTFIYPDKTGFHGHPHEFIEYALRRNRVLKDDFEVIHHDPSDPVSDHSYEILPGGRSGKDSRF